MFETQIMNAVIKKLKNRIGTSMIEMLATVVLLGIMGVALTVGVSTIQRTYSQIVRKANEQTLLSTTLIEMRNAIRKSVDSVENEGIIRFKSEEGYWFEFRNANAAEDEKGIQIEYYQMKDDTSPTQTMPVVSEADGKISDVYSKFGSITGNNGVYTITGLEVGNGTDKPTKLDSYNVKQIVRSNGGSE